MTLTDVAEVDTAVRRIETGNFDWIVARHQRQIYRILLCMVRDADVADTLTQECFLRAFAKRDSFRGDSGLSTWLVRIAINLAHDHNRSRRWAFWQRLERKDRIDMVAASDNCPSPERALINRERVNEIQAAVDTLSDRQKTIFLLRYVEELPLETISEAMNLELATVKTHLHRAVEAVRAACSGRK